MRRIRRRFVGCGCACCDPSWCDNNCTNTIIRHGRICDGFAHIKRHGGHAERACAHNCNNCFPHKRACSQCIGPHDWGVGSIDIFWACDIKRVTAHPHINRRIGERIAHNSIACDNHTRGSHCVTPIVPITHGDAICIAQRDFHARAHCNRGPNDNPARHGIHIWQKRIAHIARGRHGIRHYQSRLHHLSRGIL